jgi:type IV secretory pathway VirB2 component (pilin)
MFASPLGIASRDVPHTAGERHRGSDSVEFNRKFSFAAGGLTMLAPMQALAQVSGADPQGSGVIISAVSWLQGTLMGTVATVAAVIAVACVGFMMLTGRINWRHGAVVILGCFILFGAASIVAGIRTAATGG